MTAVSRSVTVLRREANEPLVAEYPLIDVDLAELRAHLDVGEGDPLIYYDYRVKVGTLRILNRRLVGRSTSVDLRTSSNARWKSARRHDGAFDLYWDSSWLLRKQSPTAEVQFGSARSRRRSHHGTSGASWLRSARPCRLKISGGYPATARRISGGVISTTPFETE